MESQVSLDHVQMLGFCTAAMQQHTLVMATNNKLTTENSQQTFVWSNEFHVQESIYIQLYTTHILWRKNPVM